MKLLLFGASGKTGQHVLNIALNAGHMVTAFVRSPEKIKINNPALQVMKGDVSDYKAVETAIIGHYVLLSTLGANSPFKFDQVVVDGISHIIKAMQETNVGRFIYLSFIGVNKPSKDAGFFIRYIAPRLLKNEIAGH